MNTNFEYINRVMINGYVINYYRYVGNAAICEKKRRSMLPFRGKTKTLFKNFIDSESTVINVLTITAVVVVDKEFIFNRKYIRDIDVQQLYYKNFPIYSNSILKKM